MSPRHLRPSDAPATPPERPTDLPNHLVATPVVRGLRRLGVGTVPFSIASFVALAAMSTFVVMSPSSIPGLGVPDELAARDSVTTTVSPSTTPRSTAAPTTVAESTTAASTTAPTTTAPTSRPATRKSTTTTAKPTVTTTPKADLVSQPVSARPVRCEDFTLQPEAQASFEADPLGRIALDGDGDGIACEQLPGRILPSLPALSDRRLPTVQQMLTPSTRLYGLHTPQAPFANSEIDSFTTAAGGKAPNTMLFFQNFSQDFPLSAVTTSWSRGMLPMVTFEPIIQNSEEGQPLLADITNGDWDEYFTDWAAAAKEEGHPIAFRFAQEMNGNWYPWSDGRFGNADGDFILAWRHIHGLFEEVGADNVIWVWSVNRVNNLPDKTVARVYPGDDYVDWVGASGYLRDVPDGVAPTFDFTFGQTLAAVEAVAPDKLVMLTEVGAGTTESNRVEWLGSFFQGLLDHPEIIGFNWFNDFKDGGDWRIQYSSATSAAFASGVADARYGELAPLLPA
jgi:hypothetical protein